MQVDKSILTDLLDAAMSADYTRVRRIGSQLAKRFAEENDLDGAKAIQSLLRRRGVPLQVSGYAEALPRDAASRLPLVEEAPWPSTPLLLNRPAGEAVGQFLEDARNIALLAENGVSSRLGLLLFGPPGTGKSLLAGHVAAKLQRPFYTARLDSLISSRLGETSKNIRGVFDFIPTRQAVLFLDEMDAVAKLRDDRHELGELKRVVNTVLQGLDSLTDDVIVVGATNHPHLLDPAIWRRFPYKIELQLPEEEVRTSMWRSFLFRDAEGYDESVRLLARVSAGLSGADIENVALAARRRALIGGREVSLGQIVLSVADSRAGNPRLPDARELTSEDRRRLALLLDSAGGLSQAEIARVAGVSRQMIHKYRKEAADG
jgi:MoxR-like ATPase